MRYLYFHIYNRLYQDGKINNKNHPELDAFSLIACGSCLWFLVFYEFYYYCILNINFPANFQITCLVAAILISSILYFLLVFKEKYKEVYSRFRSLNIKQMRTGLIISISYVFLPIIIGAYITLKWHGKL